jgi:DNA-binding transcriptional LysR family regulator
MSLISLRSDELTIQQLRSFCAVYEHGSYADAAEHLGIAIPTIWEQVRTMASRYGVTLFRRSGRRIEPTTAATVLFEALRPVLAGVDSSFHLVQESLEGQQHLTIIAGVRMLLEDLGEPLARFHGVYPQVRLRLMHGDNPAVVAKVLSGDADLGMTLEPDVDSRNHAIIYERAYPIEGLALIPTAHPLSDHAKLSLADLVGYPLIVGHKHTYGRHLLEQALHRQGLLSQLHIVAETDNSAFTCACVRAGLGVGIVAGRPDGMLCRGLVVRSLRRQLGQTWIAFARQAGRHPTMTMRNLMRLIIESAGQPSRRRSAKF